jgi:hypothetical protein
MERKFRQRLSQCDTGTHRLDKTQHRFRPSSGHDELAARQDELFHRYVERTQLVVTFAARSLRLMLLTNAWKPSV